MRKGREIKVERGKDSRKKRLKAMAGGRGGELRGVQGKGESL